MGPAPWLCPLPVPVPHGSLMESSYGMLSPACVGSGGQTGVPAARLRALSPALGNRGPSARFTAAIKSELALALLLHGHSLGINRSLPAPGSGSTISDAGTPPRSPLPASIRHVPCTPAFWQTCGSLRGDTAHPSLSHLGVTSLFSGNAPIAKQGIFRALFPSWLHTRSCGDTALPFPARSDRGGGGLGPRVPGSGTAPPWVTRRIPRNLGILLPPPPPRPRMFTPRFSVWPHFGVHLLILCGRGGLLSSNRGAPEPIPDAGGGSSLPAAPCLEGGTVREAISQPVFMCRKTTRVP